MDSFEREAKESGYRFIAGIDEAGRGPLAGPVVSSAVIFLTPPLDCAIKDSKKLTPLKRQALSIEIYKKAAIVGVGIAWPEEIDKMNIHRATLKSMERAVEDIIGRGITPDFLLIDGLYKIDSLKIPQRPIVKGDCLSVTIAAASIIAKVARDNLMRAYHRIYPAYNFFSNKGYPTAEHIAALRAVGQSPIHRRSFSY